MKIRLKILDEDGNSLFCLNDIEDELPVETLRGDIAQNLSPGHDFVFKFRKVPLSSNQEKQLKISRIKYEDIKTASSSTMTTETTYQVETNLSAQSIKRGNPYLDSPRKSQPEPKKPRENDKARNSLFKKEEDTEEPSATIVSSRPKNIVRIFTDEEIKNAGNHFEYEKRVFWNSLSHKIEIDSAFSSWTVPEKHGLLDTEWTLKLTELLRIESDKQLMDHKKYGAQKAAKIRKLLDKLILADFQRRRCYEKIEKLHSGIKDASFRAKVDKKENELHDLFTAMKNAQANLAKCLLNTAVESSGVSNTASDSELNVEGVVTDLTVAEESELAQSVLLEEQVEYE